MSESTVEWERSRFCADSACVEVALIGHDIAVRDSKDLSQPVLRFTRSEWDAFIAGVEAGDFRFN